MLYLPDELIERGTWAVPTLNDDGSNWDEVWRRCTLEWGQHLKPLFVNNHLAVQFRRGGMAAIFVRRAGAHGLGHVAWGYLDLRQIGDFDPPQASQGSYSYELRALDTWVVGSVENTSSHPVSPSGETASWWSVAHDPCHAVANSGYPPYDSYKLLPVGAMALNREAAAGMVMKTSARPYLLAGMNCLDAAYEVLAAYGVVGLPRPEKTLTPNWWFDAIDGPSYSVVPMAHSAKCPPALRTYVIKDCVLPQPDVTMSLIDVLLSGGPPADTSRPGMHGLHVQYVHNLVHAPGVAADRLQMRAPMTSVETPVETVRVDQRADLEAGPVRAVARASAPNGFWTSGFLVLTDRYLAFGPQGLLTGLDESNTTWLPLTQIRPETIRSGGFLPPRLRFTLVDGERVSFAINSSESARTMADAPLHNAAEMAVAMRNACGID